MLTYEIPCSLSIQSRQLYRTLTLDEAGFPSAFWNEHYVIFETLLSDVVSEGVVGHISNQLRRYLRRNREEKVRLDEKLP
jgi:hypothetical protein